MKDSPRARRQCTSGSCHSRCCCWRPPRMWWPLLVPPTLGGGTSRIWPRAVETRRCCRRCRCPRQCFSRRIFSGGHRCPPSAFFEVSVPLRPRSCPNLIVSLPPAANCGAVRLRRSLRYARGRRGCGRAGRGRPERRRTLASARTGGGGGGCPAEGDRWLVCGRGMPGFGRARPNRAEALSPHATGAGGAAGRGGAAAGSGGQGAGRPRVTGRL